MAAKTKLIVNVTRGECLCVGVMADRPLTRMKGLIGRGSLPAGEGMLLRPAPSIHTAFMRFPIDAVFLDRDLRVLEIVERLRPWRVASKHRARAVLELSAGECARRGVHVGDRLALHDRKPVNPAQDEAPAQAQAREAQPAATSASIIWPTPLGGERARGKPMRVLVISRDRHFCSVTSMLLARRGCSVITTTEVTRVPELIAHERADVVVIDAGQAPGAAARTVAAVGALAQPVGVVVVDEAVPALDYPAVLAKWGPFEDLFAAIEAANEGRGAWGATA